MLCKASGVMKADRYGRSLSDVSPGARQRYSLVVDEDVKKPTKQTNTAGLLLS